MKYYSVLEVTPTDESWIPSYIETVTPLIKKYNGTYLARTTSHEILEGDREQPGLRIILEWNSTQDVKNFMADPDYTAPFEARTKGSISHHALIAGQDDLA